MGSESVAHRAQSTFEFLNRLVREWKASIGVLQEWDDARVEEEIARIHTEWDKARREHEQGGRSKEERSG